MKLRLFNTLQGQLTELELTTETQINIYLCGPTVYDHIHVGNLRPVIVFDVLIRLLNHLGLKVNYVHNITDIDDKIIAKAEREKISEQKVSRHYTKCYLNNLLLYNITLPNHFPRVTTYINSIQKFISELLKKGVAYQQTDEIFFRVAVSEKYGELSGQKLANLKSVRETQSGNKIDSKDFVLWKKTDKGIKWNSPWGEGRPGWHTECVVFIHRLFNGQTITIHGGGNDLIFPHHENERIQYLTHNNQELSQIWLHVAHINWQETKMSKSLGNALLAKHFWNNYGANTLRYLILNTSHKQVINLNEELIQQSRDYLQKINNLLKKLKFYLYTNNINIDISNDLTNLIYSRVIESLLDNLNTVKVFYYLEQVITLLNNSISQTKKDKEFCQAVNNFYLILDLLGFKFDLVSYDFTTKLLIRKWLDSREKRQYNCADEIRKKLQDKGVL